MKLPNARNNNIVVQELGKELLIYDLLTHKAYQLNETSMIVFNHCDGRTSFDQLRQRYKFTDELIYLTLDTLAKEKLLVGDYQSRFAGVSRRAALKKVGLACAAALPVIVALSAPTAASAASTVACVNTTGPQRAPNTFLGYRSPEFCANDAFTCCSNSTRYNPDDSIEINNLTHQRGYACYCN